MGTDSDTRLDCGGKGWLPIETGRCGTCVFSTDVGGGRYGVESLCCHRFPPTIHRKWFRLVELYPDVHVGATCGEYAPRPAPPPLPLDPYLSNKDEGGAS